MAMSDTTKNLTNTLGAVSTTLTRTVQGAYDAATSTRAASTTTTYTFNVIPEKVKKNLIDGDNVRFGDMIIHFSPAQISVVPAQNDKITIYGEEYKIESVERINFKGSDALYSCVIRRSTA